MKKSFLFSICLSITASGHAFACDGIHPSPECPIPTNPENIQDSPRVSPPQIRSYDGGYATGNNCYLGIDIENPLESGGQFYQIEILHPSSKEWILIKRSSNPKNLIEVGGEFPSIELQVRVRAEGTFVDAYFGRAMPKYSEFSKPQRAFCQAD